MSGRNDEFGEFYVGWAPRAPAGIARRARLAMVAILLVAVGLAALFASRQRPFTTARFEFGVERTFRGVVRERPYPLLVAEERSYLLSASGKFGVSETLAGLDGLPVVVTGSLVERDGRAMIELHSFDPDRDAVRLDADGGTATGRETLVGEIVDSKCWLGVMKPGHTKPHRACAVRCISGGIPPLLLVVAPDGTARELLLAGAAGERVNRSVLPFVAERVEVTGEVVRHGDVELLLADPATYRRR